MKSARSELRLDSPAGMSAAISLAPRHKPSDGDFHLSVGLSGRRSAAAREKRSVGGAAIQSPPGSPAAVAAAKRELAAAEDSDWTSVRSRSFTRWVNSHLKARRQWVLDLTLDLSDGLKLACLIRVLTGKKVAHLKKRPVFRSQKIENVTLLLRFLEKEEQLKLNGNIDGAGIVDGRIDLVFDLLWTLILQYSLRIPLGKGSLTADLACQQGTGGSPTQDFLKWIQSKLPEGLPVHNFTSDWKDGRALGALVDAMGPGLLPQWRHWPSSEALQNAVDAMEVAQLRLGLFKFIRPADMVAPTVDELSIITYLSQFLTARLIPGSEQCFPPRSYLSTHALAEQPTKHDDCLPHEGAAAPLVIQDVKMVVDHAATHKELALKSGSTLSAPIKVRDEAKNDNTSTVGGTTKAGWGLAIRQGSLLPKAGEAALPTTFLSAVRGAADQQSARDMETSFSQADEVAARSSLFELSSTPSDSVPRCVPLVGSDYCMYGGFSERVLVW